MDAAGIDVQVLSHIQPAAQGLAGEGDWGGRWLDAQRAVGGEIAGGAADGSLGLLVFTLAC